MLIGFLTALAIGLFAGVLSGSFGIGGASVTTPLMRMLLGVPGHIALGTPLLLVLPSALTGVWVFYRRGLVKFKTSITCGLSGSVFAVLGALYTVEFSSKTLMLMTSVLLIVFSLLLYRDLGRGFKNEALPLKSKVFRSVCVGGVSGFVSGFLGIGGGFILVPLLVMFLRVPLHKSIASSLAIIAIYAVPGAITHFMLGHVDLSLAGLLLAGQIVGSYVGAKNTVETDEKTLKNLMVVFLLLLGVCLAVYEFFI